MRALDAVTHVTKVDPADPLPTDLDVLAGTDLVLVGGSDGVTEDNTKATVRAITDRFPDLPIWQEPYSDDQVSMETIELVDRLSIPAVYNGDWNHFVGKHVGMFTEVAAQPEELLGTDVPFVGDLIASHGAERVAGLAEDVLGEGYVIQNLDSAAADRAGVTDVYTTEQIAGAALATESLYGFPVFYVEYSGTYGGPEDVAAAARYLEETALFYGGGIDSGERASEILAAGADAIVVGDVFHEDPERFRATIP